MNNQVRAAILEAQGWGNVIKPEENPARQAADPQKTLARDNARAKARQAKNRLK